MVPFIAGEKSAPELRDFIARYMKESGYTKAMVAVSGGIDSACIAWLLRDVCGPDNVTAIFLPSQVTTDESARLYRTVVDGCGIKNEFTVPIGPMLDSFTASDPSLNAPSSRLRLGNIAARIRMILTYDFSAKYNALVVGTENKTEYLLGYSTQWGDAAAGIHPMGGLFKTEIFTLGTYLGVPEEIVRRKPTAELWADQTDEGELGVLYATADEILYHLVDCKKTKEELIGQGFAAKDVERVIRLWTASAFKRRFPQSAPVDILRR